ncbi:MAG TPA: pyridoxamine 5'-phosphate oxidase family protein [Acidimicrobiales bacterium]|nr:pyridoxamine 5'-phosphate oxidase family protein [Acidimicrobiales bacterium]
MRALDLIAGTEIVPETVCWEMLASQSIGRVVFCHEGRVEVFPVNYALHENHILFATNHGRKLAGVAQGEMALEVDSVDPTSRSGWSVVARGTARRLTEIDSGSAATIQQSCSWTGTKDFVVLVRVESITGRRVSPA